MAAIPFQPMMESRPIREIAYEVLKHAIITGEIPAGERIVETEYADRLHISRTPLREALRKLERDGLVEYVQRRGVIVRAFTIADVEEIYTIRNALEMLTLPAIIQKATADDIAALRDRLHEMDNVMASRDFETLSPMARAFHRQMTEICGQNRILRVIEGQGPVHHALLVHGDFAGEPPAAGARGALQAGGLYRAARSGAFPEADAPPH